MNTITRARKLTETLRATKIQDEREHEELQAKVDRLFAQLSAAWTNPAIEEEAAVVKCDLSDAWYNATH